MNDVKAGGAYIEMSVRNKMKQGLDEASNRISKFMGSLSSFTGGFVGSLAGLSVGGIVAQMENILGTADRIADSSAKIGMSAEAYQQLSHAAEQSGTSIDAVSAGVSKFSVLIGKAEMGNKLAAETLAKYGLSLEKLKSMTPEQKLQAVADVIASMPDQSTRAAAAMELMGKSAVGLVPLLSGGSQGVAALREQAKALGLVSSNEDIQRAGNLADVWATVRQQLARVVVVIYNALVPAMEKFAEASRGVLAWTIAITDKNRGLVQVAFSIAAAIGVAAAAYGAYQLAVLGVSAAMGVYTAATTLATSAAVAMNIATAGLPLLIGSIAAAVLVGVGALLYFSGAFSGLGKVASDTLQGIYDAIAGGNLSLAWNIAMTGMKLGWAVMVENIMGVWNKLVSYISAKLAPIREQLIEMSQGLNIISGGAIPELKRGTRKGNFDGESTPQQSESQRLQKELADLQKQAAAERAKLATPENQQGMTPFDIEAMLAKLGGDKLAMAGIDNGMTSVGSFSSAAAGMLGGGAIPVQQKILDEAEKQSELLGQIVDNTEEETAVFE